VEEFIGKQVVVDVESPFVYLGRLHAIHDKTVVLKAVDVHDLRDSTTTREVYVREARVHGVQPNRKTVYIRIEKVVSVSPLEDVIE
jgi:small nuclear ribonucleoprotein (snRNP)-like protein